MGKLESNPVDITGAQGTRSELSPTPDFGRPPVSEVVLSVQFEPIENMRGPQVGLLWAKFRHQFPRVEEHEPLAPVFEKFGSQEPAQFNVRLEFSNALPARRAWLLNERGDQLLQIQPDRLIHNWRKLNDEDTYPSFRHLFHSFALELREFQEFVSQEKLGELFFNQCEVTYVNHIVAGAGWETHAELDKVFTFWSGRHSDSFLPAPEDVRYVVRYIIPGTKNEPIGRLHVMASPIFQAADKKAAIMLNLTARCRPEDGSIEGAYNSLETGHQWVTRGFVSITTEAMHRLWERKHGI